MLMVIFGATISHAIYYWENATGAAVKLRLDGQKNGGPTALSSDRLTGREDGPMYLIREHGARLSLFKAIDSRTMG